MKVTLKEIAKLTGVSLNTVSRALNDMPDIGKETKERVRQVADMLGYSPNAMARALVSKRSFTIGLITTELDNPVRSALIEELRRLVLDKGYQLLVSGYEKIGEVEKNIREMTSRGIDGLIIGNLGGILAEMPFWPVLEGVLRNDVKVVFFNRFIFSTKVDNIFIDYSLFAYELTRHLIEKHKLKNIQLASSFFEYDRGEGYKKAMQEAGLGKYIKQLPLKDYHMAPARESMLEYLAKQKPPQAIVCHNDIAAIGVMSALCEKGFRVPEDVAVVGLDNIEVAEFLNPKLTTAGISPSEIAKELFDLLLDRIEDRYSGEARQKKLPFELFFRESCGCCKIKKMED